MTNVLAVDIGGTHFRVGLFDTKGRCLLVSEGKTKAFGCRYWMLSAIQERAQKMIAKADFQVEACGIRFGGQSITNSNG